MVITAMNGNSKSTAKKTKERVYLTEDEKKILQSQLEDWNSKPDKTSRDEYLLAEVLPKIQQLHPEKYGPDIVSRNKEHKVLWERRAEAVHTWLKNHRPFKDKAVFKLERKLSLRQVIAKLRADDIHHIILDKNPDALKGDKQYPGLFQQALTECMQGLTEEEVSALEKTRKEWQEIGPPMDVRLRHSTMDSHDYVADIHLKSHGKKLKTFKEWNPKGYDRIVEDLIGYADYVSTERQDTADPDVKESPVTLNTGAGLLPLLPPPANGVRGSEIAKQAQEIVRAYFLRHYRE